MLDATVGVPLANRWLSNCIFFLGVKTKAASERANFGFIKVCWSKKVGGAVMLTAAKNIKKNLCLSIFLTGLACSSGEEKITSSSVDSVSRAEHFVRIGPTVTLLKRTPQPSSQLSENEKCYLEANKEYVLSTSPKITSGHYSVNFKEKISGCMLKGGYIYVDHIADVSLRGEHYVKIGSKPTLLKDQTKDSKKLPASSLCYIPANTDFNLKTSPKLVARHYEVELKSPLKGCSFTKGYLYEDHVRETSGAAASGYCSAYWEEKPGTTDYTIFDQYMRKNYHTPDRKVGETLLRNSEYRKLDYCQKAKFLRHCFVRTMKNTDRYTRGFVRWAEARGLNPELIQMAIVRQETQFGTLEDSCRGGSCNGIGIGQIITAIDENGRTLSTTSPRWDGITFNILTNLRYSVRVLEQKSRFSSNLYNLAVNYNGHPDHKYKYADSVHRYYRQYEACFR